MSQPTQLVVDGILTSHHIYRAARFNMRELDLCTGQNKDDFPELVESSPGQYFLPNCAKSLANGDERKCDQWETLQTWHAGLSCMVHLNLPIQYIVSNTFNAGFQSEFENAKATIKVSAQERYQQFLCYELHRGTPIPAGIGIEQDGENHVCLHPTGDYSAVSGVSRGQATFVIDALQDIASLWKPFALLKLKAFGYAWPAAFPPDSELFPLRQWVQAVVMNSEADLALTIARSTEEFVGGEISWCTYFTVVLNVGSRFGLVCSYEECLLNISLVTAVRFALNCAELSNQHHSSFLLKSATLADQPTEQTALAEHFYSEIDTGVRGALGLTGGLCVVSAAMSLVVMFVDTLRCAPVEVPVLPFTLRINDCALVFDQIDLSHVLECTSSEADSCAPHRSPCYSQVDPSDPADPAATSTDQRSIAIVQADTDISLEFILPPLVLAGVVD